MGRVRSVGVSVILGAVGMRAGYAGEPPTAKIMVNPVPAKVALP